MISRRDELKNSGRRLKAAALLLLVLLLGLPDRLVAECAGDITRDGRVDGLDFAIMGTEMGRTDCFTTSCRADLNSDGEVDGKDRKILQSELGRRDCLAQNIATPEEGSGVVSDVFSRTDLLDELSEDVDEAIQEGVIEEAAEEEQEETKLPVASDEERALQVKKKKRTFTRFKDNEDGTVTDPESGLMWTKNANLPGKTVLFYEALDFIQEMNRGNIPNFGYTDWRLPTLDELRSLKDFTNYTGKLRYTLPDGHPFENMHWLAYESYYEYPSYFWRPQLAWVNSFYCRIVGRNTFACIGFVWPVRGGKKD